MQVELTVKLNNACPQLIARRNVSREHIVRNKPNKFTQHTGLCQQKLMVTMNADQANAGNKKQRRRQHTQASKRLGNGNGDGGGGKTWQMVHASNADESWADKIINDLIQQEITSHVQCQRADAKVEGLQVTDCTHFKLSPRNVNIAVLGIRKCCWILNYRPVFQCLLELRLLTLSATTYELT